MLEISVIIPVYNAAGFLEKSVESALQFEEVKEIILIEDQSKDNSLQVCRKLADSYSRIKLFRHPDEENHGAAASRNLGLDKATYPFITFLDADDYYLPNRFDAEKELFRDPKVEGVFNATGIEYLTEKGKKEFQSKFNNSTLTTVNYPAEGIDVFRGLLGLMPKTFGTFFHLNGLTIRKASIDRNNLRFNEILRVHQDSDFNLKLAYHCYLKSGNIKDPVAMRGIHDDNRITKIVRYSHQYNQRQFLYWRSLYEWARSNHLSDEYKNKIFLNYKSFDLSLKTGWKKYSDLFLAAVKNSRILKTQYRFTYLNNKK